jgi:archaetidylinositol phosphate synthase
MKRLAIRCMPYLPRRVTPNQISAFGFVAFLLADLAFYLARFSRIWFFVAVAGLLVHWVTDELDGEYARARNMTSERGFFLDIILDVIGGVGFGAGLAGGGYVQPVLVAIYLVMFLLGMILSITIIAMRREFHISRLGPPEVFAMTIILVALTFVWDGPVVRIAGYALGWFDLALLLAIPISAAEWIEAAVWLYRRLEPPQGR